MYQVFDEKNDEGRLTAQFAVLAKKITIVPMKPTDSDTIEIDNLEVFACFKQVATSVTTTTSGATVTSSTTTQFTTTESTTTSVVTTFTPEPVPSTTPGAPVTTTMAPTTTAGKSSSIH